MNKVLPPKEYYTGLPRKYIGAGLFILNEREEILIVKPNYKKEWEVPGGIVEANESPQEACAREAKEELGISLKPQRLLLFDFSSKDDFRGDAILMLFFGGRLKESDIRQINLAPNELTDFKFLPVLEAIKLTNPRLAKRLPKALIAYQENRCMSLKNGEEL